QHGMAWDPATLNASNPASQVVYLGDDGGVYHSTNNGTSWIHGTNMPFNQEYHVAISQQRPNRIATGLQDNGSNRSYNGPGDVADPVTTAWNSYGGGDGHYVAIDPLDDTYSYQCSQNASCGGIHDVSSTTTTLSAAAA